jgi:peptidoglycan/xylan/chitin deacetylase (PgdA/CDA1 family)
VTRIALTFDDGPGPSTSALLDLLGSFRVRATFFVMGRNVAEAPWCRGDTARARALVVRAFAEGHVVGNHTYSHARPSEYLGLPEDLQRNEELLRSCRAEAGGREEAHGLTALAGFPVRLPYGIRLVENTVPVPTGTLNTISLDPRLPVLASLGRTHVHWTSDFEDWALPAVDGPALAARMAEHVENNAELGLDAVLDLHDSGTGSSWGYERPATVAGVARFLELVDKKGWETFTVPV